MTLEHGSPAQRAWLGAGLLTVGFEAFVLARPGSPRQFALTEGVLLALVGGLAAVTCIRRAQRERGDPRRAWVLLASSLVLIAAGMLLFGVLTAQLGRRPEIGHSLADLLAALAVPFAVLGVAGFAGPSVTTRAVALLDAATVTLALLFVGWAAALGPITRVEGRGRTELVALVYAAGVFGLFALVLVIGMRWRSDGQTLVLLGLAFAVSTTANCWYAVTSLRGTYEPGDGRIDVGWVATFCLIALAAQRPTGPAVFDERRLWGMSLYLPYAGAAVVAVAAGVVVLSPAPFDGVLAAVTAAMVLVILLRQAATLREHHRLTFDLEQQVQERTAISREHAAALGEVLRNSPDVIAVVDLDGALAYASPASESLLGVPANDLLGVPLVDLVHPEDRFAVEGALREVAPDLTGPTVLTFRLRGPDGGWCSVEASASSVTEAALGMAVELNIRDISERTAQQEELVHLASFDPLTSLANRRVFDDRLQHALDRAQRSGDDLAVLYIDLDDFKRVNDALGHSVGDELLVLVAERLRSCLRPSDTAARLGGDEFAILLEGASSAQAQEVAGRVVEACAPPYRLAGRSVSVTASVGVTSAEPGAVGAVELVRDADAAMYRAKSAGRGRVVVFDAEMDEERRERHEMGDALHLSLERDELRLVYQPVLDLTSGAVAGLEALLRWQPADGASVAPARFLPIAAQRGLGPSLDGWVLRNACRQLLAWQHELSRYDDLRVHVNLLMTGARHRSLVDEVSGVLRAEGLSPRHLVLEVSQNAVSLEDGETAATLSALHGLGVPLFLDDVGTGSTSLGALRQVPLEGLKLDSSVVRVLDISPQGWLLVRGLIDIAHALDLTTVAEGVELPRQDRRLRELGCDLGQGRFYAPPLSADEVPEFLRTRTRRFRRASPRSEDAFSP